jgi:hypothetical protein
MLKKIMCVAALSACINSALAGSLDWMPAIEEDPMTDEKSVTLRSFNAEFYMSYSCTDNKDKSRSIYFMPVGTLMYMFGSPPQGKSIVKAKIRIDKGKIHEIDLERDRNLLFFFSKPWLPEQAQKFAEFEKDLLQSTSRVVLELDGTAYIISSGDARASAKTVIDVCGALSPAS